jgi:hypothetical protein
MGMDVSSRVILVFAIVTLGCSNGATPGVDASLEGGGDDASTSDDAPNDAGITDAPANGDMITIPMVDPLCAITGDAGAPTGSCITLNDSGVECNPITNAPCKVDAGEACDFSTSDGGGFQCFAPPPPNTVALCATCDDKKGPACRATSTCVFTMNGNECAQFCCVDGDCGSGHCDMGTLGIAPVGVCVK